MSWKEKVRALPGFVLRNFDVLLIMGVAAAVLILDLTGNPNSELVNSTILALLGAMAFVLLRDRHGRAHLDELTSLVQDILSDRPYEVQNEQNSWVLQDEGKFATITKTQQLLFTRNKICTLEHWCTGASGTIEDCKAEWRLSDKEGWLPAEQIHVFGFDSGQKYLFCLDTERSRGDVLQWRVTRKVRDRFPAQREAVSLKLQTPTHRPQMRVVWPQDRKPQLIEIVHDEGSKRTLKPQTDAGGNTYVDEELAPGAANSVAKIEWTW